MHRNIFTQLIWVLAFLACTTASQAQFTYMGTFNGNGRPDYLLNPGDVVPQAFKDRIENSLPEYYRVPVFHPEYLANTPTDLKITQTADVWVTYVTEGASYRNTLGYYTYPTNNPPATPPAHSAVKIIYPNASNNGLGGSMLAGDKVFLGQFPAGISIGWVLISDGWNGNAVDLGRWVLYSTPAYNPEADPSLKRHNVQLLDTATNTLVIGFEDNRRDSADCDHDFNDLLFYVRVNPFNAADTNRVPFIIDTAGNSGGGNNGGLESESLGDRLLKHSYSRLKNGSEPIAYNDARLWDGKRRRHQPTLASRSAATKDIADFVPRNLVAGYQPFEVSPNDLVGLTRAVDVFAIDFTRNGLPKATILALETRGRYYSHTKSICDRFLGAQLLGMDSIGVNGYKLIRFTLRQKNGSIEYATAFVAGAMRNRNSLSLQTNWNLSDLQPEDTMFNFQIWASTPHHTIQLAADLIDRLKAYKPLVQLNSNLVLPKAYVTLGARKNNKLQVFVTKLAPGNLELKFEYRNSETDNTHLLTAPVTQTFGKGFVAELVVNEGYEFDGGLYLNGEKQDMVYLTDGGWGTDLDRTYTEVLKYDVQSNTGRVYRENEFPLYRTATVQVKTSDYVSLFKMLAAGSEPVDMRAYRSLVFSARGNHAVEVVLGKKGIRDWKDQYRKVIQLKPGEQQFKISLDDFVSRATPDKTITADDLLNVTFTALANSGNTRKEINMTIADMAFSKEEVVSDRSLSGRNIAVTPNPVRDRFVVALSSEADRAATILVRDMNGRLLHSQQVQLVRGQNTIPVTLSQAGAGRRQGIVSVVAAEASYESKTVVLE